MSQNPVYQCDSHPCMCGDRPHYDSSQIWTEAHEVQQEPANLSFDAWENQPVHEPVSRRLDQKAPFHLFGNLSLSVSFWLPEHFPPHAKTIHKQTCVAGSANVQIAPLQVATTDANVSTQPQHSSVRNDSSNHDSSKVNFNLAGVQATQGHKRPRFPQSAIPLHQGVLVNNLAAAIRTVLREDQYAQTLISHPQSDSPRPTKIVRLTSEGMRSRPRSRAQSPIPRNPQQPQHPAMQAFPPPQKIVPFTTSIRRPVSQMRTNRQQSTNPSVQAAPGAYLPSDGGTSPLDYIHQHVPFSRYARTPSSCPNSDDQTNTIWQQTYSEYPSAPTLPQTGQQHAPNVSLQLIPEQTPSGYPSTSPHMRKILLGARHHPDTLHLLQNILRHCLATRTTLTRLTKFRADSYCEMK